MGDAPTPLDPIEVFPDPADYRTLRRIFEDPENRIVLSLGGGSVPGLCGNLALIRLLEHVGVARHVKQVWGTSAGAVVGSGWCSGNTPLRVLELVRSLDKKGALDFHLLRFALRVLLSLPPLRRPLPDGVIKGRHFRETIRAGLLVDRFEECRIPFRCVGVSDDGRATTKVFRRGELLPAVFASMSLPGIVEPMPVEGRCYYDGGLTEKTPLTSVISEHGTSDYDGKLVILATHFGLEARNERSRGFLARFMDTLEVMEDQIWLYQLQEARERDGVRVLVLNPHLEDAGMFAFDQTDRLFCDAFATFGRLLRDAQIAQTFGLA